MHNYVSSTCILSFSQPKPNHNRIKVVITTKRRKIFEFPHYLFRFLLSRLFSLRTNPLNYSNWTHIIFPFAFNKLNYKLLKNSFFVQVLSSGISQMGINVTRKKRRKKLSVRVADKRKLSTAQTSKKLIQLEKKKLSRLKLLFEKAFLFKKRDWLGIQNSQECNLSTKIS